MHYTKDFIIKPYSSCKMLNFELKMKFLRSILSEWQPDEVCGNLRLKVIEFPIVKYRKNSSVILIGPHFSFRGTSFLGQRIFR